MAEPEGDDGGVDAGLKQGHGAAVIAVLPEPQHIQHGGRRRRRDRPHRPHANTPAAPPGHEDQEAAGSPPADDPPGTQARNSSDSCRTSTPSTASQRPTWPNSFNMFRAVSALSYGQPPTRPSNPPHTGPTVPSLHGVPGICPPPSRRTAAPRQTLYRARDYADTAGTTRTHSSAAPGPAGPPSRHSRGVGIGHRPGRQQVGLQLPVEPAGGLGGAEPADEVIEGGEVDRVAGFAGGDANRRPGVFCLLRVARGGRVGFRVDKRQGGQVADFTGVEFRLESELELVEGFVMRQAG